jgi:hypothetical protein
MNRIKGVIVAIAMTSAAAVPAIALAAGPASASSPAGACHGAFANVNGNFGFLGLVGGTPGYHDGATGQDPGATGYNNSVNGGCPLGD